MKKSMDHLLLHSHMALTIWCKFFHSVNIDFCIGKLYVGYRLNVLEVLVEKTRSFQAVKHLSMVTLPINC